MKIKTALCLILCLVTILSFSGCGGKAAVESTPEPGEAAEPTPTAEPVPTAEPLPDVDITSWEFLIANTYTYIGRYAPPNELFHSQLLDERIIDFAEALISDAEAAGYPLYISVASRHFDYYEDYYTSKVRELGSALEALKVCPAGGCSDHSTGLAIDFTANPRYNCDYEHRYDPDFENTEAFQWLLEHCQEYGFVQRYPEGKEEYYGLGCCPGHFRYVGVEAATYMKEHNLCLEEFVALYQ